MSPILSRAEKKSASLGVGSIEKQWASLAAFVGIPLPGTGAWTGAMGAFLLGMPTTLSLCTVIIPTALPRWFSSQLAHFLSFFFLYSKKSECVLTTSPSTCSKI